jgi:hypothetical protein
MKLTIQEIQGIQENLSNALYALYGSKNGNGMHPIKQTRNPPNELTVIY